MIASAEAELLRRTLALLGKEALLPAGFDPLTDAKSYSTPRRLAVLVSDVLERQPDLSEEVVGPSAKIAFKDGAPAPAAEAFARKNGVDVSALRTITTPKGDYVAVTTTKVGRAASEVIASELPKEIAAIYWAKNMRWIAGSKQTFVRPVQWIVALLGEDVVPVSFGGRTAGRASFGHRVLSSGEAFEIETPASYVAQLEGEYVIADVEARRHKIRKALDRVCRTVPGARWREDEALVDKMTHLTEWPDVLLGSFDAAYLDLPEEVLVTVMRDHQNYFAVESAAGKLAPYFLAVTNIALDEENAGIVRQGNERVLRARFNDARFFYDFDQRTPLVERVKLLENVTFQKDLGSYAKKSERVRELCHRLAMTAGMIAPTYDVNAILDAASLAKTDLTTELVKEFTELQGIIGGLYAEKQGVSQVAAEAIYDQYLPASADDRIPRSAEGALLGLADRIDTIAGMFSLGMEPTGSKDPFALRRAANAVVRILAESGLPLTLSDVMGAASPQPEVEAKLKSFFAERVEFYLREAKGQAYDVVKAVMAPGYDEIADVVARAEAVSAARGSEDFLAVSAAFKRMKNILAQAGYQGPTPGTGFIHAFEDPAEAPLARKSLAAVKERHELSNWRSYGERLASVASIRPEVDAFFAQVMVMDPDIAVRTRRLNLLYMVLQNFSDIADFSEIVTAG
ncbi:glycyl-tRNA synthetase beta chain [Bryocella elongata]|uniref:Glycine--tRNA ligase beta subunit n=2 Tax=Bryocella elongata TaxID=863522 RepID=A0A1H5Z8M1_9BACT|nr:glycyl-tRNA synthetase beta chain [Bryocella elongata]